MANPTKAELATVFDEATKAAEAEGRSNSKITQGLAAVIRAMPQPDPEVVARILQDINMGREVLRPTQDWSSSTPEDRAYYLSRAEDMIRAISSIQDSSLEPLAEDLDNPTPA